MGRKRKRKKETIRPGQAFMSSRDLADRWGVHKKTILRKIKAGGLPAYKFRGCLRIAAKDIHSYELARKIKKPPI